MNISALVLGEMYLVSNWLYPHIAVLEHLYLIFDVLA